MKTTLCYIEKDGKYLMLHRVKKQEDMNGGKWIGVGGKLEEGETPEECLVREVLEETGLTLTKWRFCGEILFQSDKYGEETMYLYHGTKFSGEVCECDEGYLAWVDKDKRSSLPMWEGDRIFFEMMQEESEPFGLTLRYKGDELVYSESHPLG